MTKKFELFAWFVVGSAIGMILYVLFLAFYPFRVSEVLQPYRVLNPNKTVKRGETLLMEIKYIKYMNVRTQSDRMILCEDGNLVTMSPSFSNLPLGEKTLTFNITIPEKTSVGKCKYQQVIQYFINPIQTQTKTFQSEEFVVI